MFTTPKQTAGEQYALAVGLSVLASIFVALRFYARRMKRTPLLWDDWLILFALIFTIATGVLMVIGTAIGDEGQHRKFRPDGTPITDARFVIFIKTLFANQLTQLLAVGPTKLSVLLFYRRIFRGRSFDITIWSLIAIVIAWTVGFFFGNLFQCFPVWESWTNAEGVPGEPEGNPHCFDSIPMYLAQAYSDVIIDVIILLVPMPLVWKLHLPLRQKIMVSGIFLLGALTVAASCAKMVVQTFVGHELAKQADTSYFLTPIVYWPMIESALGIVAACLPMLRPLFHGFSIESIVGSVRSIISLQSFGGKDFRARSGFSKSCDNAANQSSSSHVGLKNETFVDNRESETIVRIGSVPLHALKAASTTPSNGILVERDFDRRSDRNADV